MPPRIRRLIWCVAVGAMLLAPAASAQSPPTGAIAPPLSPRNASYAIEARLDAATHTITGSETITWRNLTAHTATELQFHLYWNAWRDDRSTYMRESSFRPGRPRPTPRAGDWARIDVTSISLSSSGADLTAAKRFHAPDDGNHEDGTVMAVSLPQPLPPDGTATVNVKWTAHVPRTFSRTGVIGNYFFIAQWFPKLGVLEDEGWNCHQFHAGAEFFSDYGVYDVRLTVPKGWPLGATGVERDRRDNADNTTTHHYYQEDVHDFAWTTSPDYIERTATFEHNVLPPVAMRLLLQPEHAAQADRHFTAARVALKYYGEWFGAYPYGHLTIVDPAYQSGAGGMEYPTLITAGTRWLVRRHVNTPESVTVHEAGHQFWYGIVGNNETEHGWMDEGFNSFSEARAAAQALEPSFYAQRYFGGFVPFVFTDIRISRETDENGLSQYRLNAKTDAQATPTFRYWLPTGGSITYFKTALWLNTMERWLGWPALQKIMAAYFERWKFRHPKPNDFFDVVGEVGGQDLGWYFDQVHRSSNVFDYGVQELKSVPRGGGRFRTSVVVRRYGEAIFPVDVLMTFKNGEQVTERWSGEERWKLYSYDRASQAVSARVDPNRVLLLDVDYTNNSKTLAPKGPAASTKWALKWMMWLQDCLLSWSFFV